MCVAFCVLLTQEMFPKRFIVSFPCLFQWLQVSFWSVSMQFWRLPQHTWWCWHHARQVNVMLLV